MTPAQASPAHIHRDGIQPRLESRLAAIRTQRAQRRHKRILRRLVGFGGVTQDGIRQPIDEVLIGVHQSLDRGFVAVETVLNQEVSG